MTGREASTKIMMLLLEQILELASACFQRSNYKLCICVSLATRQAKIFKTIRAFARARKYGFNFRGLQKINLSSDPIPLKGT
jgi:hypothetical protein